MENLSSVINIVMKILMVGGEGIVIFNFTVFNGFYEGFKECWESFGPNWAETTVLDAKKLPRCVLADNIGFCVCACVLMSAIFK